MNGLKRLQLFMVPPVKYCKNVYSIGACITESLSFATD